MIINEEHKFIFIHVPKTAGNTVRSFFPRDRKNSRKMHYPFSELDVEGYFSFGFVRNPWERLLSHYSFCCQKTHSSTDNYDQSHVRNMGFEKWLLEDQFMMTQDYDLEETPIYVQARDQMWWLDGVDYIGRFESLQEDMNYICKKTGTPNKHLPRLQSSNHPAYRDVYTDEMIAFVADKHKRTIDKFGYEF